MRKRIVSMFLVTIMAVSSFGTTVSASAMQGGVGGETDIIEENEAAGVEIATPADGDIETTTLVDVSEEDSMSEEVDENLVMDDEDIDLGDGSTWSEWNKTIFLRSNSFVCPEELKEKVEAVVVPDLNQVTEIADGAFENCTALETFWIQNNQVIYKIGKNAFKGCESLKVFDGLKYTETAQISDGAFAGCTNLQGLNTIPMNVTFEGDNIFSGADNVVLRGYTNSPADKYAQAHGIAFESCGVCHLVTCDSGYDIQEKYVKENDYLTYPSREGYLCLGWFTEKNGGNHIYRCPSDGDITLYAHWKAPIVLNAQGGNCDKSYVSLGICMGGDDKIQYLKLPLAYKEGYYFDGWYTAAKGGTLVESFDLYNGADILYAHWTTDFRTIKVEADLGNGRTEYAYVEMDRKTKKLYYDWFPSSYEKGYVFDGWYTQPEGGKLINYNDEYDGSTVIYSHWSKSNIVVKLDSQGGECKYDSTELCGTTSGKTYYFYLPICKKAGYYFDGWYTEPEGGKLISKGSSSERDILDVEYKGYDTLYAHWILGGTWEKDDNGYRYIYSDGKVVEAGWKEILDKWYYFDDSGYAKTGWMKIDSKWYCFNDKGVMSTGWVQDGDKWYYMDKEDGTMVVSKWIDAKYYVKSNGVMARDEWVCDGRYYVNSKGELASKNQWIYIENGRWDEIYLDILVDNNMFKCPAEYKDKVEQIDCNDVVTRFVDGAFENCVNLKHVTRWQAITNVGKNAFKGCRSLRVFDVLSDTGEIVIGDGAFYGCTKLEKIYINSPYVTFGGDNIFTGDDNLVIYGYTNSPAEKYAKDHNLKFESLGICYPVTYDLGNQTITKYEVAGKKYSLWTPERVGYLFKGWYTEKTGGKAISESEVCNGETTIYAQWEGDGTGWRHNSKGYWFVNPDGSYIKNAWKKISNIWYYFGADGYMVTGWKKLDNKWYYFSKTGAMQRGWVKYYSNWYYFESNGVMAKSKWIDDTYYVKDDGTMAINEWVDNDRYFVDDEGKYKPLKRIGNDCIWNPDTQTIMMGEDSGNFVCPKEYKDKVKDIYAGGEKIADGAFENCTALLTVYTGPGGGAVNYIGKNAFKGCTNLIDFRSIDPEATARFGDSAFRDCPNLESIKTVSNAIFEGDNVFLGDKKLEIEGMVGSSAEEYANKHGITFKPEESGVYHRVIYDLGNKQVTKYVYIYDTYASWKPERAGYTFAGWYTAKEGGNKVDERLLCKEDTTVYAHWIDGQWMHDDKGWWFKNPDGSYVKNSWKKISGKWYYFDTLGYMVTGWKKISGKWYYFDNGKMVENQWVDNEYYMKSDGTMASNEWIGDHYFKEDGTLARNEWIDDKYVDADGVLTTLIKIGNDCIWNEAKKSIDVGKDSKDFVCPEEYRDKVELVYIDYGQGEIAEGAFENCTALKSVLSKGPIPGDVVKIGKNAFKGCTELEMFTAASAVDCVQFMDGAFEGCTKLEELRRTSPNAVFESVDVFAGIDHIVLHVYEDSPAEEFAKTNDLDFVIDGKCYLVSYDLGSEIETRYIAENQGYILWTPEKIGAEFVGWFSDEKDGDIVDWTAICTGETTLYARWYNPYETIRIKLDGGVCEQDCATTCVGEGGKYYYADLPIPTKDGYLFVGWDIIKYYDTEEQIGREMGVALNGVECEDPTYVLVAKWDSEDGYVWDEETKTLTILGKNRSCPIIYRDIVEKIFIKNNYTLFCWTEMPMSAFEGCSVLKEVYMDDYMDIYTTIVGDRAFANCPNLERVHFSRGVFELGENVFLEDTKVIVQGYSFPSGHDRGLGVDYYMEKNNIPFESLGDVAMVQGNLGNQGDVLAFELGKPYGKLPEYTTDGFDYIYDGWAFDPEGKERITEDTICVDERDVYCLWYSEKYDIEFDTNGSDEIIDNICIINYAYTDAFWEIWGMPDLLYGELPTPARLGYTFEGWYTAAQGGSLVKESTVFDGHTKLYAHWTEGEWEHNDKGYWFEKEDGSYAQNVWMKIQGQWYYFDKSGYMATGWRKIDNVWYYLTPDGYMATEWQKVGNKWYYFGTNGAMKSNWQKIGNKWYYFEDGALVFGWHEISGKWYYFEKSGEMAADKWINDTYYVKANGVMATNEWVGKYYVDANGKYVPGKKR